jgi:pSer/pThr/pTyr-binding forkhead associated (FHA) protein
VSVHDLGSTNGISVNGRKTESAVLADGATIRIGNTTLTLHLHDHDGPARGAAGV